MQNVVVLVDGFKIRNTLDDDFGIFHTHSCNLASYAPKFYIPEGEIWIDHLFKDEADFLMAVDSFFESEPQSAYEELRKRAKDKFRPSGDMPDFTHKTEKQNELLVRYVNGGLVRKYFDPEFIFGGHDLVYPDYIPKGEVWLDMKMDAHETPYILHHELIERNLMKEGKPYHSAHEHATVADKELRRRDGALYPGDPEYPWAGLTNHEIITSHYVVQN